MASFEHEVRVAAPPGVVFDAVAHVETFSQIAPDVVAVDAEQTEDGSWTFRVTLSSPYDTPERYADGWRVVGPDGTVFGVHDLAHDHADEQALGHVGLGDRAADEGRVGVEGRLDQVDTRLVGDEGLDLAGLEDALADERSFKLLPRAEGGAASPDPEVVAALHTHAAEVSDMADRGMQAVHERMMRPQN